MKKQVNGKVVDVKNIELFESAAEGMAVNRTISNNLTPEGLDIDYTMTDEVVKIYKKFYDNLPFPLYGIDNDIKYCAAGLYIKKYATNFEKVIHVSNGLWVLPKPFKGYGVHFVNNSWAIELVENPKLDNCNIRNFESYKGYEEFVWILASLFNDSPTNKYYERFMPKFLEACNNQPMILKWELGNILQFGYTPAKVEMPVNRILDLKTGAEYIMDIFLTGYKDSVTKTRVWTLDLSSDGFDDTVRAKQIPIYGFEAYEKVKSNNYSKPGIDKMKKVEMYGLNSLFLSLCGIKQAGEQQEFSEFTGIIADSWLLYCIEGRVFVTKAKAYTEPKEIGRGVEIFSYKYDTVFLSKKTEVAPGVIKEAIYSYNLKTDTLRLCRILFNRGKRK